MINRLSIRLRLTILCVLLLTICCVMLTFFLNTSAYEMADVIKAVPMAPALEFDAEGFQKPESAIETSPTIPLQIVQTAKKSYFSASIVYMLLVVVAGGIITYYISGRVLKPLSELSSQMKNRTVHNLSESFPVPQSHDELADLATSFNEMSAKLSDAFDMQKRFSQSAAHELRTPLTVLKTKVEVFKKKDMHTEEEYTKLLDVISTHTNRLSNLVQDLLELTNMDSLEYGSSISIKALLTGIVDELSPIAAQKQIDIKVNGDEQVLLGNKSLLHRAYYNLIENAINYNNPNGSVVIEITADDEGTTVAVRDTGIGIPAEVQGVIFEPFFRVDKSRSRQAGGVGLGLSIVKSIIKQHGGDIAAAENPGGGAIFTVHM